jgi:hypothetical protein
VQKVAQRALISRVILEDFAARPHSSGANAHKVIKQSSKILENPINQYFQAKSPIAQVNAAYLAIFYIAFYGNQCKLTASQATS